MQGTLSRTDLPVYPNNFNLLRFIAAGLVILSHSFPLTRGNNDTEPLFSLTGVTFGNLGVYIFFAISGYLITGSFIASGSIWKYALKRALRIYPALIAAVVFCIVLGLLVSDVPVSTYIFSKDTLAFWVKNSTLLLGLHYHLPGVFVDNPLPHVVNGSLWTLPEELRMYIGVGVAGLLGLFRRPLIMYLLTAAAITIYPFLFPRNESIDILLYFMTGSAFYLSRHVIQYRMVFFFLAIVMIICSIYFQLPVPVLTIPLTYCIFYLAFSKNNTVLKFNNYGDYSYGLYIYAFPIQQFLVLQGFNAPYQLFFLSFLLTLLAAFCSWHLIEKKALKFKPA
ncbi:MAG TPA: acyltransferase [Ohtaekwangia sp.]